MAELNLRFGLAT